MSHSSAADARPLRALADKLAIVLLTYNCADRLEPVLDRLVHLGVPIVAVDNASADDTVDVLARHPEIDVVRLERNTGAAGRNVGLERAGTPYVAFCDDDGWYEPAGLAHAVTLLDQHPRLALVNARILVGDQDRLDPISAEMADSPLPDRHGIPGSVLLGFMGGAAVVRADAYQQVGGYDERFFMGGEEETLAVKLAKAGWQMRYVPEVVVHHMPSVANAPRMRAAGLRNTLWSAWLHRPMPSALRWTAHVLVDRPKTRDWLRGVGGAIRGVPWVARHRQPMSRELDSDYRQLDARHFGRRQSLWNRHDPMRELARTRDRAKSSARAGSD